MPDQRSKKAQVYRRWYKTARWQKRRAAQIEAHPLCYRCQNEGRVEPATVANHKAPHKGDEHLFWHGELESVCKRHHDSDIQSEERRGYSKAVGADGWPTDDRHPANR